VAFRALYDVHIYAVSVPAAVFLSAAYYHYFFCASRSFLSLSAVVLYAVDACRLFVSTSPSPVACHVVVILFFSSVFFFYRVESVRLSTASLVEFSISAID
jgi:hypothetical protein